MTDTGTVAERKYEYGYLALPYELTQIKKGEVVVYYCGHLALDKRSGRNQFAVGSMAMLATNLYNARRIDLRTRRVRCMQTVSDVRQQVDAMLYLAIGK